MYLNDTYCYQTHFVRDHIEIWSVFMSNIILTAKILQINVSGIMCLNYCHSLLIERHCVMNLWWATLGRLGHFMGYFLFWYVYDLSAWSVRDGELNDEGGAKWAELWVSICLWVSRGVWEAGQLLITHWSLGGVAVLINVRFSNTFYRWMDIFSISMYCCEIAIVKYLTSSWMISPHCFKR